eukprot:jgi/Botrbrau1/2140/Bobra.0093s0046.1
MAAPPRGRPGETRPTSTLKQYYVEVLQESRRLDMLVQMVHVLNQYQPFGLVVICSGRDTLDDIIDGLSPMDGVAVYFMHTDLEEWEKHLVLVRFKDGLSKAVRGSDPDPVPQVPEAQAAAPPRDYVREALYGVSPSVLICTDAAARGIEVPPQITLLCSYNLPPKKDVMGKRVALLPRRSGAPRNVVHFCVTSQSEDFQTLQDFVKPHLLEDLSVPLSDLVLPLKF